MMQFGIKKFIKGLLISFSWLLMLFSVASYADSDSELPEPSTQFYVADYANIISAEDSKQIVSSSEELNQKFKAQIVVATLLTINGEDIDAYANQLFRKWQIGDAEKNNGVLLLVVKNDHVMRVEVGYGLEGAITDGYSGEIIDGLVPYFKKEKYSEGIIEAYKKLATRIYEENNEAVPESLSVYKSTDTLSEDSTGSTSSNSELTYEDLFSFVKLILVTVIGYFFLCCAGWVTLTILGLFLKLFGYDEPEFQISFPHMLILMFVQLVYSVFTFIIGITAIFNIIGGGFSGGSGGSSGGGYSGGGYSGGGHSGGGGSSGGGGASGSW